MAPKCYQQKKLLCHFFLALCKCANVEFTCVSPRMLGVSRQPLQITYCESLRRHILQPIAQLFFSFFVCRQAFVDKLQLIFQDIAQNNKCMRCWIKKIDLQLFKVVFWAEIFVVPSPKSQIHVPNSSPYSFKKLRI